MKRHTILFILTLALITFLTSCSSILFSKKNNKNIDSTVSSVTKEVSKDVSVLTPEKIKEKYKTENIGEIVEIYDYKNYILVQYVNESSKQCFDLYNLETGDRDILSVGSEAEIFNFSSGDHIELKATGLDQFSGIKGFPYYIVCNRVEEVTGRENDFHVGKRELYKQINEEEEFGVKRDGMLSDMKVTLTGFEMEFAPQKGKEMEFYAGSVTTQAMKTSYDNITNQFLIELISTTVSPEMLKKEIEEQNRYIDSIEVKEKGANSLVIVNLKDTGKLYTAEWEQDEFPRVRFIFRSSR
ncbi:MAG: hypothetical protein K0R09_83 [Clostridiales bacterium]|jgi:hypothetical protein|nr:hypothetical protein [Clostridiales bacterium]